MEKSSRKAHLSCCQMTTFFWCCIIYFTSSCLVLVNISQSNHLVCFLDHQPLQHLHFYVIIIKYRLQRRLVDKFELNFEQFNDNMIQMNVICGANFKVPRDNIFLKENCQLWIDLALTRSSFTKLISNLGSGDSVTGYPVEWSDKVHGPGENLFELGKKQGEKLEC